MRVPRVVVGLGLLAAGLHGCSSSEPEVATTTTTVAPRAASTTTVATAQLGAPERPAVPDVPLRRHGLRDRAPRAPRVTRQMVRTHIAQTLAARRPDRQLSPAELEQLTTKAMQIRVVRSRLARMRPATLETPRAASMRARLEALKNEFQTAAGVRLSEVPAIFDPPPPPPRGQ